MNITTEKLISHLSKENINALKINKKELDFIENYIDSYNFSNPKNIETREEFLCATAYALKNPGAEKIVLQTQGNYIQIKKGLPQLAAARLALHMDVECVAAIHAAQEVATLLKLDKIEEETLQTQHFMNLSAFLQAEKKQRNIKTALYEIKQLKGLSDKEFSERIKNISSELWQDKEFCENLIKKFDINKLGFVPVEHMVSDTVLNLVKEQPDLFIKLWRAQYQDLFYESKNKVGIFLNQKAIKDEIRSLKAFKTYIEESASRWNDYHHHVENSRYYDVMNEIYEKEQQLETLPDINSEYLAQAKKFIKECKTRYFTTIHGATDLIQAIDNPDANILDTKILPQSAQALIQEFSKDILSDIELIKKALLKTVLTQTAITKYLSNDVFKEKTMSALVLQCCLANEKIPSGLEQAFSIITSHKDVLIHALSTQAKDVSNNVQFLYNKSWGKETLKDDVDVINTLMNMDVHLYEFLDDKQRHNINWFNQYIKSHLTTHIKTDCLPIKLLNEMTDEDLIDMLIKKNNAIVLNVPVWRERPELLLKAKIEYSYLVEKINIKGVEKLMQKHPSLHLEFMDVDTAYYVALPKEMRSSEDLAKRYLSNIKINENIDSAIPQSVFASKAFSLKALEFYHALIKRIPPAFKEDMEFILKICQKIDNQEINVKVLNGLPEIQALFKDNDVKADYHDFLMHKMLSYKLNNKPAIKKHKI